MKKFVMVAAIAVGSLALPAHATVSGFTGPYAPNTWTTTVTGNLTGPDGGSASISGDVLTIVGGDDPAVDPNSGVPACVGATTGLAGPCEIDFTTTTIMNPFSFHWTYVSSDEEGAGADLFGVLIDGVFTELSDPGGPISQSGNYLASANTSFGFAINCTDCVGGSATATVSAFRAAVVPEPGTIALLGAGVVMVGVARRKRPGLALRSGH